MADDNNPIYYKDLVSPDNSITDLIKQLDELSDVYANALKNIKAEAIQLAANLQKVSGATETGRKTTRAAATETDKLARAQRDLAFAESENALKLAEIKQAQREANEISKLTVKLNQSAEGSYNKLSAQYSLNKIYLNNMTIAEREGTVEGKKLVEETRKIYEEMDRLQRVTGKFSLNVGNYPGMTEALGNYGDKVKEVLGLNTAFGNSLVSMFQSAFEAKKKMLEEAPGTLQITGGAEQSSGSGINTEEIEEATIITDELGGAMEAVEDGGEGLKGMFTNLGTNVKAFGQTLLGLLVNPVFLVIAGIAAAGAAFKFWFDYNKGLIEATNLTQQFTGLSGDAMKAYRNEVQALADMYDKDFKEVLEGANAVAKQFGISQQEALGYVRDGFLAGADANGEYLEGLKEYPAYFKEAGLSASEFIAISTQANKSGIYSDKAVDTIKEGNLRIREMTKATADALTGIGLNYKDLQTDLQNGSKTTFDVMQLVSEKLNELPASSAVVGTAIADIFGGAGEDAGLEYLKTLKDIDTNLDNVKAQAGELGKLQEDQLRSQAELNNVIAALFDSTGGTFESMTARAKTFVNDGLIWVIKGIVDIINYGIKLYNDSVAFQGIIQGLVAYWNILWTTVKSVFTYMIDTIGTIGSLLRAVFTLDFDEFSKAWNKWGDDTVKLAKNIAKGAVNAVVDASKEMGKKIKPITIPVLVSTPGTPAAPAGTGKAKSADYSKPAKDNSKDLEAARKKNLELMRKAQDAQLELETDGFKKREQQVKFNYARQIEDLQFQLLTEKTLTVQGKRSINEIVSALEKQQTAELIRLEQERNVSVLEQQKIGLQIRLDSARKGSEQEYQLKLELLEKERQLELAQNKQKPIGEQQSEGGINAKFDTKKTGTDDEFLKLQLARFDAIKNLEQSEFDLLRNSEDRKTRFRLNAEKERLQKILALNQQMGNKLTDVEVATIQNTISKIDQEISKNKSDERGRDIYGLFGLNLDDDAKEAISESVGFAMEQMSSFLDAKVAMADVAVAAADKEVDASQRRLDAELEARANGYANDVVMAQKELDNDRKAQDKANKDKAKAVKQQQALDTISQTSSLITASAGIWASLSSIPIIGTGLAIAALGLMWGSFAASKIMARQVTKGETETYGDGTLEFLGGGSHQSGNDVDLGKRRNGTRRRAEGGEAFAVINKMGTRRFRRFIPDVINSLNNGTFANKYLKSYDGADGLSLNINGGDSPDMKQIKGDVADIKEQGKRRYYSDGNGTVEVYKNLRRRIKNR